jgi:hypothetical protein
MAIVQSHHNLLKDVCCLLFIEEFSCNDSVKKLTTSAKFCDQVDVCLILEILVKLDDVGMVKRLENLDLS